MVPLARAALASVVWLPPERTVGFRHGALFGHVLLDYLAHGLHRPGQDDAQQVEAGLVGDADGVGRNVLVVGVDNPPGDGLGSSHCGFLHLSN